MKRLYVGNLPPNITVAELRFAFSPYGEVVSVTLARDSVSGFIKGFAYIEMDEVDGAIAALNRTELKGRTLTVCGARPQNEVSAARAAAR